MKGNPYGMGLVSALPLLHRLYDGLTVEQRDQEVDKADCASDDLSATPTYLDPTPPGPAKSVISSETGLQALTHLARAYLAQISPACCCTTLVPAFQASLQV